MSQRPIVCAWLEEIVFPTCLPAPPDRNPMFLEKRVYQGSGGKVYPLPFTDRIAEKPVERKWKAVWIENEFLRVLALPEIGGRIHRLLDKTNRYDLIHCQPVIKPALVGLGPSPAPKPKSEMRLGEPNSGNRFCCATPNSPLKDAELHRSRRRKEAEFLETLHVLSASLPRRLLFQRAVKPLSKK